MFSSKKNFVQVSIYIDDSIIRYLVLNKDENGFFVEHHDEAFLPQGVIVKGEILKAQVLLGILKKIQEKVTKKLTEMSKPQYSLLLKNDYFLNTQLELPGYSGGKNLTKQLKKFLSKHREDYSWFKDHNYRSHFDKETSKVYIQALPIEVYKSYQMLLTQAGMDPVSIYSDLYATEYLLDTQETAVVVVIGEDVSRVVEYRNNHYLSDQKFQVSYQKFTSDIIKNLGIKEDEARDIVRTYGVSRAHRDQKVYQHIMRSITPLVDFLRKRKTITQTPVCLWYLDTPVLGMADLLQKRLKTQVHKIDPLRHDTYFFHDIISLHRDDSHRYSLLLAHAAVTFQK